MACCAFVLRDGIQRIAIVLEPKLVRAMPPRRGVSLPDLILCGETEPESGMLVGVGDGSLSQTLDELSAVVF